MGQQNNRQIGNLFFDFLTQGKDIHIRQLAHGDHHVKFLFIQHSQGFLGPGNPGKAGRIAQVQAAVFMNDAF